MRTAESGLKAISSLIRSHQPIAEDLRFTELVRRLRPARTRKYLTKGDLVAVCRWKSPRVLPLILQNSHHHIRKLTEAALGTRVEAVRMKALISLRGVSVPMASSALSALNAQRYGVIDIRVWKLLYKYRLVTGRAAGTHLSVSDWEQFLVVIRSCAKALSISARSVEHTLFRIHQKRASGPLYE